MLGEERWRDRCDRYFSSINDIRKEVDAAAAAAAAAATATTAAASESAKKYKKDRDVPKKSKSAPYSADPAVNNAAERTSKTKQTTKKTTEDRVIIRAHGRAYRTKHRPFKGPRRWLSSLDLHGTSMLQRTESATYFFVWLVIVMGGCAAMGYFFHLVIDSYLKGGTHFKVSLSPQGFFDLGLAVSVCNLNPLRKNHISNSRFARLLKFNSTSLPTTYQQVRPIDVDLLLQKTQFQRFVNQPRYSHLDLLNLLEQLKEEYAVYGAMRNEEDWDSLYAASIHTGEYEAFARALRLTAIEMSSMGHHMQGSLLQCLKNGHDCGQQDVSYPRVMDYGNCVTINVSSDASNWFDSLSLIYDVEPEEYVDYVTSSRGMRVFLHIPESGFWKSIDYLAPVGSALKLHVTKVTEIQRLSSSCSQEAGYDHDHCMLECMEEVTRTACGCARTVGASLNQRCRVTVQLEYLCYRTIEILAKRNQLQCDCPLNCRDRQMEVQVSQIAWPTQIYENHLRRSFVKRGIIKNFPSLRDSVTKIQVKLDHTQRVVMTEERDVSWLQLLIQLGALSALTAGISMVTGIEIVWLIGRTFCQCLKAAWRGRHEENQVKALTTESLPEFDDLGFNWYSMQNPDSDRKPALAPMVTTETELTPPAMAPNLQLGLDPIVEESDVDIRAVDGAEEDNLYTHAWERSGQSRAYTRVLVSGKDANISDAPMLNAPGNHGSLRSEMYRAGTNDSPPSASQINALPAIMGTEKQTRQGSGSAAGGNYILKSRQPYTWHSAHFSTSSPRQTMMTPADFINVYGQPARQLYEDDNSPTFYLR